MIADWTTPFELETPAGTLPINQAFWTTDDRRYVLNPGQCSSLLPVRVTDDDIPQGDGGIPHRRWRGRYGVHLAIQMFQSYTGSGDGESEPACDQTLVEMVDELGCHLNLMPRTGLVPGGPNARLIWTPYVGASDDRMLDGCQLAGPPTPTGEGTLAFQVEVDIDSKHPYYIAVTQDITEIADGATEAVVNAGNVDTFVVIRVDGPTDSFSIINHSVTDMDGNPLLVLYDADLPGASPIGTSEFLEFVFFDGTAFLDGNVANYEAGVDYRYTTFFPLVPECEVADANQIEMIGADATILSNSAWA